MADKADVLVMFDLETGGTEIGKSAIIQIAAAAFNLNTFEIIETFERKVQFLVEKADPKALEMNSYNQETWEREAVVPAAAMRDTLAFLEKYAKPWVSARGKTYKAAELVGHNIIRFDWPFFEQWCKRLGKDWLPIHNPPWDTIQVAQTVAKVCSVQFDNLKLETLADYYGIEEPQTHDAFDDVKMNIAVLQFLLNHLGDNNE